jgi:hypothetical protein
MFFYKSLVTLSKFYISFSSSSGPPGVLSSKEIILACKASIYIFYFSIISLIYLIYFIFSSLSYFLKFCLSFISLKSFLVKVSHSLFLCLRLSISYRELWSRSFRSWIWFSYSIIYSFNELTYLSYLVIISFVFIRCSFRFICSSFCYYSFISYICAWNPENCYYINDTIPS